MHQQLRESLSVPARNLGFPKPLVMTALASALLLVPLLAVGQTISVSGTSASAVSNTAYISPGPTWYAENAGGFIDASAATGVSVESTYLGYIASAVQVEAGGKVDLGSSIEVRSNAIGVQVRGTGSLVEGRKVDIQGNLLAGTHNYSTAMVWSGKLKIDGGTIFSKYHNAAWAGWNTLQGANAIIDISNATLTTQGANTHAARIQSDSQGIFNNVILNQSGTGASGSALYASYGSVITAEKVTATSDTGRGLNANEAGKITLIGNEANTVKTTGLAGLGVRISQNAGYAGSNDKITQIGSEPNASLAVTTGPGGSAYGVYMDGTSASQPSAVGDFKGPLSIATSGSGSHGIYLYGDKTSFTAEKLEKIEATTGATTNAVNVSRGIAKLTGIGTGSMVKSPGIALLSSNGATSSLATVASLTGAKLNVTSTSAEAASAQYGGEVILTNTQLTGATNGVLMKGNTNQPNAAFSLSGGSIVAQGGDAIKVDAGVAASVFTVDIEGGATVDATTPGASGNVLNLTSAGTVNLGVTTGRLKGLIQQGGSGNVNVTLANANSVWTMTGDSVINDLVNNGVIETAPAANPANPGDFYTLTVNGKRSGNGVFKIDVVLGGDSSLGDFVRELGGSTNHVGGTVSLDVRNPGGAGADTVNGIKVAEIVDDPVNANVVFTLSHPVTTATHEYYLEKKLNDSPGFNAWYLKSKLRASNNGVPIPATGPLALLLLAGVILGIVRQKRMM